MHVYIIKFVNWTCLVHCNSR